MAAFLFYFLVIPQLSDSLCVHRFSITLDKAEEKNYITYYTRYTVYYRSENGVIYLFIFLFSGLRRVSHDGRLVLTLFLTVREVCIWNNTADREPNIVVVSRRIGFLNA